MLKVCLVLPRAIQSVSKEEKNLVKSNRCDKLTKDEVDDLNIDEASINSRSYRGTGKD